MKETKFKLITHIDRINYFSDNFINYYKQFFLPEEFYFMVHNVNEEAIRSYLYSHGFTDNEIESFKISTYGWGDNIRRQNQVKSKFISLGFVVLYADQDERIFHPDLRNYIINNLKNWMAPTGISLMQHPNEPFLDKNKKILEQRNYCKLDVYWFSKTCILKRDYEWLPGRHNRPSQLQVDSNLYLVDVGKCCKNIMIENNIETSAIYNKVFWRYSTQQMMDFEKVFSEHKGNLIKLPSIIKESLLF